MVLSIQTILTKKTTAHQLLLTKSTEINILPQAGMLHKFPEMQT